MKRKYLLLVVLIGLSGIGATVVYTINDLTANNSPSAGTIIEIYDPTATPKSGKYLLTNLVTVSQLSTNLTDSGTNVLARGAIKADSATLTNGLTLGTITRTNFGPTQVTLTHAGTVTLTLGDVPIEADLSLTGAVEVATSGLAPGRTYVVYGRNAQATNCTPTFPAWQFQGGAPSTITAGKAFVLSLSSRGTVDTNVWAAFSEAQ